MSPKALLTHSPKRNGQFHHHQVVTSSKISSSPSIINRSITVPCNPMPCFYRAGNKPTSVPVTTLTISESPKHWHSRLLHPFTAPTSLHGFTVIHSFTFTKQALSKRHLCYAMDLCRTGNTGKKPRLGSETVCASAIHESCPYIGPKILPSTDSLHGHQHLAI